jgi:hypothetical protein
MTAHPDTLVTAVEVQHARTRLTPLRKTGTLRYEAGHVAFEGSDGRQRFRVPVDQVTDVVRHRAGFGFWVTFGGRRYFVVPRTRPRPGGYNAFSSLTRPITTVHYLWWRVRGRRRGRALTRQWLLVLTQYDPGDGRPDPATARPRGLRAAVRIPIRVVLTSVVVLVLPTLKVALDAAA